MRRQTLIRLVLSVMALAVTVWVFNETLDSAPDFDWPAPGTTALACICIGLGLAGAAWSWSVLFEGAITPRTAVAAFLMAQPAKYMPVGGVAQAVGQIGLSDAVGLGKTRVASLFLIHAGVQVCAGLTVGGLAAFTAQNLSSLWRVVLSSLLLAPLMLNRRILTSLLAVGSRLARRNVDQTWIPSQPALIKSAALAVAPIVASGTALTLLIPASVGWAAGVGAFGAAWSIGFLALPFPSGVGVREGVLIALLGINPALAIAGSVAHRLATIAVEGVGVVVAVRLRS